MWAPIIGNRSPSATTIFALDAGQLGLGSTTCSGTGDPARAGGVVVPVHAEQVQRVRLVGIDAASARGSAAGRGRIGELGERGEDDPRLPEPRGGALDRGRVQDLPLEAEGDAAVQGLCAHGANLGSGPSAYVRGSTEAGSVELRTPLGRRRVSRIDSRRSLEQAPGRAGRGPSPCRGPSGSVGAGRRVGESGWREGAVAQRRPTVSPPRRCRSASRPRLRRQPGHRLHVAADRDDPAGARVGAQLANRQREAARRADQRRVVREREVRLGHADRQLRRAPPARSAAAWARAAGDSSTPAAP